MSEPIMVGGYDLSKVPKGNRATKRKISKMSAKGKTTTLRAEIKRLEQMRERDNKIDKNRWQSKGLVFMARVAIVIMVVGITLLAIYA